MITNKGKTEDQAPAVVSQEVPSAKNIATTEVVPKVNLEKEIATMRPPINKKRRKRYRSAVETNAPPKVLRKDYASVHQTQDTRGGKLLATMGGMAIVIPTECVATTEVNIQFFEESPESGRSTSAPFIVGSPSGIYQPGWGVTNDCRLDTPEACQDMVDQTVSSGFKQEVRLLKKARAQVAKRDERIQVREEEIKRLGEEVESLKVVETEVHGLRDQTKNLETLLETEVDMKKVTEAKNAKLANELESLCAKLSDLQLNNNELSQLAKGMSEGLKYGIEHGKDGRDLADVKSYDPEANNKLVKALQDLKDLKYLMVDQLEKSDDIPVSVPTVVPQGLAILLTDAGTQTQRSKDEASPRLLRSKSLPPMYNLDWP
ncbi:hypothetical protein Tco_1490839 [Tanacetum coccineum]